MDGRNGPEQLNGNEAVASVGGIEHDCHLTNVIMHTQYLPSWPYTSKYEYQVFYEERPGIKALILLIL